MRLIAGYHFIPHITTNSRHTIYYVNITERILCALGIKRVLRLRKTFYARIVFFPDPCHSCSVGRLRDSCVKFYRQLFIVALVPYEHRFPLFSSIPKVVHRIGKPLASRAPSLRVFYHCSSFVLYLCVL